ncbi:hypothetical protein HI914_04287 [Erysiphe necator]|nr:hypothetical protein HI914_04287 [Erysiphe necator]
MAPGYRNSTRRQNRSGLVDHDIFEGLPVRQWRRGLVTVEPSSAPEHTIQQNNIWAIELPHGMPKDSHLLPQHSQDLLRAARSGKIYKRPGPVSTEEEEADAEATNGEKVEKKEEPPQDNGFVAKIWKQVPRHLEGPEIEFLAKRRKGLITAAKTSTISATPSLVKTIVKKTDAIGNEYVQEIFVTQGVKAEEEVIPKSNLNSDEQTPQNQSTLLKKKGPVRKKIKPVGRGKKKKSLLPTSAPNDSTICPIQNTQVDDCTTSKGLITSVLANSEDIEIGDESVGNSEDGEADDGEENEEEGEIIENKSILKSAPNAMSDLIMEEDSTTDTGTQYALTVKSEKNIIDCGLNSKNTDTDTDKFNSDSPSNLQFVNVIPEVSETNTLSETVVENTGQSESSTLWESQQGTHEGLSLDQAIPLPIAEVINISKQEVYSESDNRDNSINGDSKMIGLDEGSEGQTVHKINSPILNPTANLLLDSSSGQLENTPATVSEK